MTSARNSHGAMRSIRSAMRDSRGTNAEGDYSMTSRRTCRTMCSIRWATRDVRWTMCGTGWTTPAPLAIGALLLLASACARPDWIEATLVTVDVTGVWQGTTAARGPAGQFTELTLEQSGPKVTGQLRLAGAFGTWPGAAAGVPIEGTVTGDLFRFSTRDGSIRAELHVNGDEMTGWSPHPYGRMEFHLRRQPSSETPGPQRP